MPMLAATAAAQATSELASCSGHYRLPQACPPHIASRLRAWEARVGGGGGLWFCAEV